MARYTLSREFYIPQRATKVADKLSDAVAYLSINSKGKPRATVFFGKQAKPVTDYWFQTEARREAHIRESFAGRRASLASKAEMKAKRTAENKLQVGDILNTCWGYDQTNREFFEVLEVIGKHVIIREIAQVREHDTSMSGRTVPQSGAYIGEPMRKLVQWGDTVTIDDERTAHKWNTATVAGVAVKPAVSWSDWH